MDRSWVGSVAAAMGVVVVASAIALTTTSRTDQSANPHGLSQPIPTVEPPANPEPLGNPDSSASVGPAPSAPSNPDAGLPMLLPNLQSLPAEDVLIEIVDGVRRLRFTSIIANTGVGPVETMPDELLRCPDDQRHASQVVYHDVDGDGEYDLETDTVTTIRPAGCMLVHPEHDHWHFDAAARYTLTEPGSSEALVVNDKVSFCWRDNREVPAEADPRPDQYYGECSRDDVQGITPGWADVYPETLADQHLDLPDDLPEGLYCLWNEADPYDLLLELNEFDNATVVAIEITGNNVEESATNPC